MGEANLDIEKGISTYHSRGECTGPVGLFKRLFKDSTSVPHQKSVPDQKGAEGEYEILEGDHQLQPEVQKYLRHLQELCLLQHNELCRLRREETQIGDYDMLGETLKSIDDEVQ